MTDYIPTNTRSYLAKETLKREAFLNYGLYVMSFATCTEGNFLKCDIAQKAAFKLGMLSQTDELSPFMKLTDLTEFFLLGKKTADEKSRDKTLNTKTFKSDIEGAEV